MMTHVKTCVSLTLMDRQRTGQVGLLYLTNGKLQTPEMNNIGTINQSYELGEQFKFPKDGLNLVHTSS